MDPSLTERSQHHTRECIFCWERRKGPDHGRFCLDKIWPEANPKLLWVFLCLSRLQNPLALRAPLVNSQIGIMLTKLCKEPNKTSTCKRCSPISCSTPVRFLFKYQSWFSVSQCLPRPDPPACWGHWASARMAITPALALLILLATPMGDSLLCWGNREIGSRMRVSTS